MSSDLPESVESSVPRIARQVPGLSVLGHDAPPLVWWRNARLRRLDADWEGSRVIVFGSTFQSPRLDATFEDMTVAQHPWLSGSRARHRWVRRQGLIYQSAACCFTTTNWAAASVRDDYGQPFEKVVVAGLAPNIICRPVAKDWSRPRLLWVGLDWHRKGGDVLLDAFRQATIDGATLDLVGQHPRVDLPGVVGHGPVRDVGRLRAMHEAATLFVLPSRLDASPIVCLEAATAGTPMVATRVGGTPEHVGGAGVVVEPYDVDGLANALQNMCRPEMAARCRAAALAQARTRSWDEVVRHMEEALEVAWNELAHTDQHPAS